MKHKTYFIEQLGKQIHQPGNKIWPVYVTLQNNVFYHRILWKMWAGNQFQALFIVQRILCKKEPEEANMRIQTNFDSFAITYLIQVDCFKNFIFQQRLWLILCKHKRAQNCFLGLNFCKIFLMQLFLLDYDISWPNFINKTCLLPKLFSKMYLLFHSQAFDDVIKFESLEC